MHSLSMRQRGHKGRSLLHSACIGGNVQLVRTLINCMADRNARDDEDNTPLHVAVRVGNFDIASVLMNDFDCDINIKDQVGSSMLHRACSEGNLKLVLNLLTNFEYKTDLNVRDDEGNTPLHVAALNGRSELLLDLIDQFNCSIDTKGHKGRSLLHSACIGGNVQLVRILITHYKADVNIQDNEDNTPLHVAALYGKKLVLDLINNFNCSIDTKGHKGRPLLHSAVIGGNVQLVKILTIHHKADLNARDGEGNTPLHVAALNGKEEVVLLLIDLFNYSIDTKGHKGRSLLHSACIGGNVQLVRILITHYKADVNIQDNEDNTPLHVAALYGKKLVLDLISNFNCSIDTKGHKGRSLLHSAVIGGNVQLVKILTIHHKTDWNARDDEGNTPLHVAALNGKEEVVLFLMDKFECSIDTKGHKGRSLLHSAVIGGNNIMQLVRTLVTKYSADLMVEDNTRIYINDESIRISTRDRKYSENTQRIILDLLANIQNDNFDAMVLLLLEQLNCTIDNKGHKGTSHSLLHSACVAGNLQLVKHLVLKHKADLAARDNDGNTPLHVAALNGQTELFWSLILSYHCSTGSKGHKGRSLLHSVCIGGNVQLVGTLVANYKADVNAKDDEDNMPLHVAALYGKQHMVFSLINDFCCDINVKGHLERSVLHLACASGNSSLVKHVSEYIFPWVVDSNGDTPLHILCSQLGHAECVQTLLELNPPVMIRNNAGKTPRDVAHSHLVQHFHDYIRKNREEIYLHYKEIQKHAKKKYSLAERITRIFVIGNPGAGKSSLIETLRREGFVRSFSRVSKSSVPPHTAGIVPSIHTSKHYGRVLFYDFAGDPEYYSSHAAILENLASSRKGDNLFVIVVNLKEAITKIKTVIWYWVSFIQYQQFHEHKPYLILVGSHLDLLSSNEIESKREMLETLCSSQQVAVSGCILLDCCKPRSKYVSEFRHLVLDLTKSSARFKLSLQASILLGLLEKDFSNVIACSIEQLLAHIVDTGIDLPTKANLLKLTLLELHDLGLLFVIESRQRKTISIVINMSLLTNTVHKSLFSDQTTVKLREMYDEDRLIYSFSAGVIPRSVLEKMLPENISKECLVQLQYCQEIRHRDVDAFPSLKASDSTDQSFLFFPALCSADKSGIRRATFSDPCYSIGWLARCTDLCDYFPPRFLHVLLLRLVFRFTLSAHSAPSSDSPDHSVFQRRCTMWKTGVHWLMEEGVECLVELVNANKEVVVLTTSSSTRADNCATVFNSIVSCVMEAKAEFCHSAKLDFFLLDSTSEADYLEADNLFALRDVEGVLASPERNKVVVGVTGKKMMECSKLLCLLKFHLWHSLFPIISFEVLAYLKDIVTELYMLGLHLDIPQGVLRELEKDFPYDTSKRRVELVNWWLSSSPDLPCWWQLVQALEQVQNRALAQEIREKYSPQVELQEKLLNKQNHSLKPDEDFLQTLADVVGSKWPSLAASLSLSGDEIEEVKREEQECALKMLRKWAAREGATYGQLYQTLKIIPFFQHCK